LFTVAFVYARALRALFTAHKINTLIHFQLQGSANDGAIKRKRQSSTESTENQLVF
jgi:hypothetical protein